MPAGEAECRTQQILQPGLKHPGEQGRARPSLLPNPANEEEFTGNPSADDLFFPCQGRASLKPPLAVDHFSRCQSGAGCCSVGLDVCSPKVFPPCTGAGCCCSMGLENCIPRLFPTPECRTGFPVGLGGGSPRVQLWD